MSKRLEAIAAAMGECYESRREFANEFQYQFGRTGREAIFTDGTDYYAIQKRQPRFDVGAAWAPHADQFWATRLGLVLWVAKLRAAAFADLMEYDADDDEDEDEEEDEEEGDE